MKIHIEDYHEVLTLLLNHRQEGYEFAAFHTELPVQQMQEDIAFFFKQYDAMEYCHEMTTDMDRYAYSFVRSMYRAMSEALQNKNLLIVQDGVVDIEKMISAYHQSLESIQSINNLNSFVMNQKNFEYLRDQVKFTGFGEGLENELRARIQQQPPDFNLTFKTQYGKDNAEASLQFRKSDQSDMYFFNKYTVNLQPEKGESMEQTFYINKTNNLTMKEAYNLMSGRAVNKDLTNKEGQAYNAWMQMDFKQTESNGNFKIKQYHQNYGFDLEKALSKHPIKELSNEEYRTNVIDSLNKGNRQSVTFVNNGSEQKHYIEANPQFKSITVYDQNMQRLGNRQSSEEKQGEGHTNANRQDAKKQEKQAGVEDDGDGNPSPSKRRKRNHGQSV